MPSISQIFTNLSDKMAEPLKNGSVLSCSVDEQSRTIRLSCKFQEYVERKQILEFKNNIENVLLLKKVILDYNFDVSCYCSLAVADIIEETDGDGYEI